VDLVAIEGVRNVRSFLRTPPNNARVKKALCERLCVEGSV